MNFPSFYITLPVLLEIYLNVPWFTSVLYVVLKSFFIDCV